LDQQKLSQDITTVKKSISELAVRPTAAPSSLNDQKQLKDLRRDINDILVKQSDDSLQKDVALLVSQVSKLVDAMSSMDKKTQLLARKVENSGVQDQIQTLVQQVSDLQESKITSRNVNNSQGHHQGDASSSFLIDGFLRLQASERQIQREALERIEEASRAWKESIFATDHPQSNGQNQIQDLTSK
jgi:hypothetical protein